MVWASCLRSEGRHIPTDTNCLDPTRCYSNCLFRAFCGRNKLRRWIHTDNPFPNRYAKWRVPFELPCPIDWNWIGSRFLKAFLACVCLLTLWLSLLILFVRFRVRPFWRGESDASKLYSNQKLHRMSLCQGSKAVGRVGIIWNTHHWRASCGSCSIANQFLREGTRT